MWCHCFNEFSNELFYKSNNLFIKWVIAHVICTYLNVCMLNLLRKHLYCISSPQEYLMKFFQKLNFHRENNDRRLEILWGFVEVDKLWFTSLGPNIGFYFTTYKVNFIYNTFRSLPTLGHMEVLDSGIFWGDSTYSRSVDLKR